MCYELNNRAKHEVYNGHSTEWRVHLIFDWYEENNEEELNKYKEVILEAVKTVITSEQYSYNFGNILDLLSIQFLNKQNQELQTLLKIFVESDLQKYLGWKTDN